MNKLNVVKDISMLFILFVAFVFGSWPGPLALDHHDHDHDHDDDDDHDQDDDDYVVTT